MKTLYAKPPSRQRGVALIEVLVAVLIFSFGVLGLIGLQGRAIAVSRDAEDRNRAALLANEVVSMMWLRQGSDVSAEERQRWLERVGDPARGGLPAGEGEYKLSALAGDRRQMDVTITWEPPGRASGASGESQRSQLTTTVVLP